ncbi:MAG: hypothetical protein IR160_05630 [Salinibacterium sp.]|nr:hypothetical protein [Salinibacterium sp.]MBF0672050.1 hypothetical protein [Salinibacterium sp.]
MSLYESVFAANPDFERRRSWPRTVLALVLAAIAASALVWLILNFADVQRGATEQAERSVVLRNEVFTRVAPLGGLVIAAVATPWLLWWAATGCHVWVRRETGARLRRRAGVGFAGGVPTMKSLHARFATGDPGVYTPVPEARADGIVEVWDVPEDSIAYVGMSVGRSRKSVVPAELIVFTGRPYEALGAALKNQLHRPLPEDQNPMRGVTDAAPVVTSAVEATSPEAVLAAEASDAKLQKWAAYRQGGGVQEDQVDTAGIARARRWNTIILAVSAALLLGGAVGLVVLFTSSGVRVSLPIVLAIFLLLLGLVFVPRMLRLRRNLQHPDATMSVSTQGITLPGVGLIAWGELVGLVYLDDTARTNTALRVPITGWGARLAFRAGEGSIGLTIGVRDGAALRERSGARIRLWNATPEGTRAGDLTVPLDVRLTPDARERFVAAVRGGAIAAGVPFHVANGTIDYAKRVGRMLDPKWPAELR